MHPSRLVGVQSLNASSPHLCPRSQANTAHGVSLPVRLAWMAKMHALLQCGRSAGARSYLNEILCHAFAHMHAAVFKPETLCFRSNKNSLDNSNHRAATSVVTCRIRPRHNLGLQLLTPVTWRREPLCRATQGLENKCHCAADLHLQAHRLSKSLPSSAQSCMMECSPWPWCKRSISVE
jgi:hypothetical protein